MLKLIIADDERIIRESISKMIDWNSLGIELIGLCSDGIEAYNMILDECPDIVLTDIRMPGLSGLELIEKISQTDLNIQFILLSGFGEFEYAKQAMRFRVHHYLLKPCNEDQLIQTNYLNEILIKEAQFKALENQMNPHFLYNTLESINWRAKILGAKDISAMAEALGSLLRITLDHRSKQVPLKKELELIQYYITIQKYRFEDRLNFQTDIPQNLLSCYVLKLTLQPLVENAIRYGLEENTEGCLISISAEACPEKDQLIIYVKNDGSAFEDDLLSKLENRQIEPHGFGIGLLNIQKRMQITYGEAYGLTLYNEEELAVAKLVYPLKPVILSPDAEASLTV